MIRAWVAALAIDVDALQAEVYDLAKAEDPPDLEEVVKALIHIRAIMAQFRDARDTLAEVGADLMTQRQLVVEGVGPIERTGGWDRKEWQHDSLLSHVLRRVREEREEWAREHDGEAPKETEGEAVIRMLREHASINYWKQTLNSTGISVDEFCRRVEKRPGIKLPPAN